MGLREAQSRSGAVFPPGDAGSGVPLHFGSPKEEYAAATAAAALFDFSDRTVVELTGSDRVQFLHSFCTNDVKRLSAGQGCEAFVTNVKGRVVGHIWVDVADSSLWLDADPGSAERLVPHLERYVINEDVAIADRSADWGALLVTGPEAAGDWHRLGIDVAALANLDHLGFDLFGTPARVRRFDVGLHRGYAFIAQRNRLADWWTRLCEAGIRPAGSAVWTALRIEAGLPVCGVDITDDNLVQEVGRTQTAVSFTKGCYLGQEPIARLDAMGHVNREFRSLRPRWRQRSKLRRPCLLRRGWRPRPSARSPRPRSPLPATRLSRWLFYDRIPASAAPRSLSRAAKIRSPQWSFGSRTRTIESRADRHRAGKTAGMHNIDKLQ